MWRGVEIETEAGELKLRAINCGELLGTIGTSSQVDSEVLIVGTMGWGRQRRILNLKKKNERAVSRQGHDSLSQLPAAALVKDRRGPGGKMWQDIMKPVSPRHSTRYVLSTA